MLRTFSVLNIQLILAIGLIASLDRGDNFGDQLLAFADAAAEALTAEDADLQCLSAMSAPRAGHLPHSAPRCRRNSELGR